MSIGYQSTVPAAADSPAGMQVLYADRNDPYVVSYLHDIPYVQRSGQTLRMQLLVPGLSPWPVGTAFPLVVYVQGSGWRKQDCHKHLPQLSEIARRGYVVASVEYRGSDIAIAPAFVQDVKTAIRFLRKNAGEYHIDTARIAVWGCSSGGQAACLVGLTDGIAAFDTEDYAEYPSTVNAVIDFYGVTDISRINEAPRHPHVAAMHPKETSEAMVLGGTADEKQELAQLINPIAYISEDKAAPPFLILHGDEDEVVPFRQSVLLYEALRQNGKQAALYKVQGAMHGVCFWTKPVLNVVANFLAAYN